MEKYLTPRARSSYIQVRFDVPADFWLLHPHPPHDPAIPTALPDPTEHAPPGSMYRYYSEAKTVFFSTGRKLEPDAADYALPFIIAFRKGMARRRAAARGQVPGETPEERRARWLMTFKQEFEWVAEREFEPGEEKPAPDGGRFECNDTGEWVYKFNKEGKPVGNPLINPKFEALRLKGSDKDHDETRNYEERRKDLPIRPARIVEQQMIDRWKAQGPGDGSIKEVTALLNRMRAKFPRATLASITYAEAKAVLNDWKVGSSTKQKPVGLLAAITKLTMDAREEGDRTLPRILANVWSAKHLYEKNVPGKRAPPDIMSETELKKIFANLPNWIQPGIPIWRNEELVCFTIIYYMGARFSEPFQIEGEEMHKGVRCIRYGSKAKKGQEYLKMRLVPLPPQVAAVLPAKIEGKLFTSHPRTVRERLMGRIQALGIAPTGSGKTMQGLRHRFTTEASNRGASKDIIETITGHVFDDLDGNKGEENREARNKKAIYWRYMRGFKPKQLLEVMAIAAPISVDDNDAEEE